MPNQSSLHSQQSGFSLLEVLVSIIILTFGILGAVGLQAASLKTTREAKLQASGVRFADEIAELMRSNHQVARLNNETNNPYLIDIESKDIAGLQPPSCGTAESGQNCTDSKDIAARDIIEWLVRLNDLNQSGLPGARAKICFDSTPYNDQGLAQWECDDTGETLSIKIGWTQSSTLTGASTNTAAVSSDEEATPSVSENTQAFEHATRPSIVIPVNPGVE